MKKRALILALAGIMAASLIGCGSLKDDAVVVKAAERRDGRRGDIYNDDGSECGCIYSSLVYSE